VFHRLSPFVLPMLLVAGAAVAEEPLPAAPAAGGDDVFVSGVPDHFDAVRAAVRRARERSGRRYRVIVVDDSGEATEAAPLLDRVLGRWAEQAQAGATDFKPADDVTILLHLGSRSIAMRVPSGLEISSGLDTATIAEELTGKVFVPRARDKLYDEGLADLVDATENWVDEVRQTDLERIERRRVFRTRTLPLGVAAIGGGSVLIGLLLQRARHARRLRQAREKLAAFKADVVALSDLLDTEQERHRMLPHTDPDFQTPMEGVTRSTYDNVQGSIRRYRERWLALMDVWEKAQERVDSEWFLGTAAADDAMQLLESAAARPPLADVTAECRGPLDALEQAHEKARAVASEVDAAVVAVQQKLDGLAGRGRSVAPYQPALAEVARGRELAGRDVERDPVAARGRLEEIAATLAATSARVEAVEAADGRRQQAAKQSDEVAAAVRARRAEGWLLAEPGANPDEPLAAAGHDAGLAAQLLDAGETDAALVHVERAEKANAEAAALLESIVAARARVEDLLPRCAARLEALAGRRGQVERGLEQLAAGYATGSWSDVADNLVKVDEGLGRVATLVDEARAAAEPLRQHYFRAVALLEEAVRQEDWVEGCQAAITDRRAELDELRAALPARRDKVRLDLNALEQRLHRQRTDRVRANERCREAGRILEVADGGLTAVRPDLRQVKQLVDAAAETAARAGQLADEDERLARQAVADIEETDAVLRRVSAWYAEGVQADVRGAAGMLETAKALLGRMQYEDSIKASAEAAQAARTAYAAATAEADRRRLRRQQEIQRRQMEESFSRMSRGAGPWVIQLPGGVFTGPDPWRTLGGGGRSSMPSRSAGSSWSKDISQVKW
jgi:hypothetical protein